MIKEFNNKVTAIKENIKKQINGTVTTIINPETLDTNYYICFHSGFTVFITIEIGVLVDSDVKEIVNNIIDFTKEKILDSHFKGE